MFKFHREVLLTKKTCKPRCKYSWAELGPDLVSRLWISCGSTLNRKKKKNVSIKIYIGYFAILLGSNFHWSVNGQLLMYHLNYPFRNGCMEKEADAQSCL